MRNVETVETLGATGAKTIGVGASLTGFGWLTSNEFLGLVGAMVAIIGLFISWHYKREAKKIKREAFLAELAIAERKDARHEREHQMRMHIMQTTGIPVGHDTGPAPLSPLLQEDEDDA